MAFRGKNLQPPSWTCLFDAWKKFQTYSPMVGHDGDESSQKTQTNPRRKIRVETSRDRVISGRNEVISLFTRTERISPSDCLGVGVGAGPVLGTKPAWGKFSGQFIINPYPNLRPFWGGFPY